MFSVEVSVNKPVDHTLVEDSVEISSVDVSIVVDIVVVSGWQISSSSSLKVS